MDYRLMSVDVAAMLHAEGIVTSKQPTVDLMGHSMGGKVAMMLALSLDLVRKLWNLKQNQSLLSNTNRTMLMQC